MALRRITEPAGQPASVAQRLREVTARDAAARGQRFELVAQLPNEHGCSWHQIGAELGITKQGALMVYPKHVQESVLHNTATAQARFKGRATLHAGRIPAVDVPLDLDWTPTQGLSGDDQPSKPRNTNHLIDSTSTPGSRSARM